MSKTLTRNYQDPESKRFWEAAEKAGLDAPKLTMPASSAEGRIEPGDDAPNNQVMDPAEKLEEG